MKLLGNLYVYIHGSLIALKITTRLSLYIIKYNIKGLLLNH